jgi:hypothetical protein
MQFENFIKGETNPSYCSAYELLYHIHGKDGVGSAITNFLLELQLKQITLRDLRAPQTPTGKQFLRKHFPGVIVLDVRDQ